MPISHTFTSPKSDGADATLVRPSNWNAAHTVTGYATDTDLTNHAAAADPHTGYQKESEKGVANGYPALNASSFVVASGVTTAVTELVMEETGDSLGTVRLRLQCRGGMTGALFENASLDLVDFAFKPSVAAQNNIRMEGRAGNFAIAAGEFQIGLNPSGGAMNNTPLIVGMGNTVNGRVQVQSAQAGVVPLTVRGFTAQSVDLAQFDVAGVLKAKIANDGTITHKTNKVVLDTDHNGLADPHGVYVLDTMFTGKGSIVTASAANTPATLTVGADDTILMADAAAGGGLKWVASQTPSTGTFGQAAAQGTADTYARGDHAHGLPADPVTAHAAAGDPHTGYRLESADHTHASTGIQAGQVAHSALTGLTNDEHTQYQKESEKGAASGYASLGADTLVPQDQLGTGTQDGTKFLRDDGTWQTVAGGGGGIPPTIVDVKGDIIVASTADTVVRKAAGADDTILMADAAQADGLKWVASQTPTTEAFGQAAAQGTADTYSRGDHAHGVPADPTTAHAAAGDPHTGYRLESADHNHASTGLQAGTIAHSALTGLTNDEHTQYVLEATAGISGTLALTADITDTSTGAINDWAPTGIGTATVIRWNGASTMTLSGITTGADGRVLVLMNVTTAALITLVHDATSTAANRIICPNIQNFVLAPGSAVALVYDSTSSRWRVATPFSLSSGGPNPDGTVSAGTSYAASRADHVHAFTPISIDFFSSGALTIGAGSARWYNRSGRTLTFDSVSAAVGTAPTGASVIVDVNKNGTTIYTTQANRPTIAVSTFVHDDTTAPNVTTVADNEYLTIDIDQIGSTVAGSDLTVQVWMRG